MPTFRIGEWLLEAPAIYRVPKLEGDFLAPIPPGSQPLIDHETWPELAFTVSSFSLEIEKEEVEVNTSSLAVCRKVQRVNIVNPGM